MLSTALYAKLPSKPPIQAFKKPAPDIVGVGGGSAEVKGYIDVPLQLAGVEVAHPLLVLTDLSFPILVIADILREYSATMSLGDGVSLRLNARVCDVFLEQRTELSREFWCPPSRLHDRSGNDPPSRCCSRPSKSSPRNPAVAVYRCRTSRIGNSYVRVRNAAGSVRTS